MSGKTWKNFFHETRKKHLRFLRVLVKPQKMEKPYDIVQTFEKIIRFRNFMFTKS